MPPTWRFIDTGSLDGSANMAVDEALLRSQHAPDSRPVLRLYGWSAPTITVGRFQRVRELLDLERCRESQVPVVRRFTGGSLVYHSHDLAYSVTCSPEHLPGANSPNCLALLLFNSLRQFYGRLGLTAAPFPEEPPPSRVPTTICCMAQEPWDIVVNGRKLGGHAMRRQRQVLFQHGTVPLSGDMSRLLSLLRIKTDKALAASTLEDFGHGPGRNELVRIFVEAAAEALSAALVPDALQPHEELLAQELMTAKYGRESWTLEGRKPRTAAG